LDPEGFLADDGYIYAYVHPVVNWTDLQWLTPQRGLYTNARRQLYGESHHHPEHRNHLFGTSPPPALAFTTHPPICANEQIWDLGGQREFVSMLPLVSNDAVAILFMFDLTRKTTLNSVKEWYRQARGFNKVRLPLPIGQCPSVAGESAYGWRAERGAKERSVGRAR
jgi:hypothetical protein